ncbi:MAG: hypothetical protein LKG24_00960 [Lacticaseibacillus songhuajiangensis]|jgi:phage-related protein|nr:hypothetical protein [Lacticaseibacillus songhuajiangensis]
MKVWDYIKIRGRTSLDFGLKLNFSGMVLPSTQRNRTATEVPGVSETRYYSDDKYNNTTLQLPFTLQSEHEPLPMVMSDVTQWLQTISYYEPLYMSAFPGYHLMVIPTNAASLSWGAWWTGTTSLEFTCKPFWYSDYGSQYTDATTLINREQTAAAPLIHLVGSGDASFTVNNVTYTVTALDGDAYVDCDAQETYDADGKSLGTALQFPAYAYPTLVPGENTVLAGGNVKTMEVMPRWRRLM